MNLADQLRPKRLEDVIGNRGAVAYLKAALEKRQLPQAILFSGASGCGKTTLAYILAAIVGGQEPDIVHVNAADTNGIEEARSIARLAGVRPLAGNRIYILDEAHQLTKEAQNCLLIPIEKPEPWAWWFICTTKPEGLIDTLRGRLTSVEVSALSGAEVVAVATRAFKALKVPAAEAKTQLPAFVKGLNESGICQARDIINAVPVFLASGKIPGTTEDGASAFNAVQAWYRGDLTTVRDFFGKASTEDVVSFAFIAVSYGASILKRKNDRGAKEKILTLTEGMPNEAKLRAGWITAKVLG